MVAFGLDQHRRVEYLGQLLFRRPRPQWSAQVEGVIAEKAEAQAAVGGEPDAVTTFAVIVREGADDANGTRRTRESEIAGRSVPTRAEHRMQLVDAPNSLQNFI